MIDLLWGPPGTALFDFYSLHHFAWFVALGLALVAIFGRYCWLIAIVIAVGWEFFEHWAAYNATWFPLAGKELLINKIGGDFISNSLGFLTALLCIKIIVNRETHIAKQNIIEAGADLCERVRCRKWSPKECAWQLRDNFKKGRL